MEVVVTTGPISRAKLRSNRHHQQTNIQIFAGRMLLVTLGEGCHPSHQPSDASTHMGSNLMDPKPNSWLQETKFGMVARVA